MKISKKYFGFIIVLISFSLALLISFLLETRSLTYFGEIGNHSITIDQHKLNKNAKDFAIENNKYTSTTGDPWLYVEDVANKTRYITFKISNLNVDPGISQVFYGDKMVDFNITNGITTIKLPEESDFNALRFDLTSLSGVSFEIEYIKLSSYPPLYYRPLLLNSFIIFLLIVTLIKFHNDLFSYIKGVGGKRIFIICFILILVFPNIVFFFLKDHIDTTNIEKRTLTEKPYLTSKTILEFPKLFDQYVTDQLAFKNQFVRVNTIINIKLFNFIDSNVAILGENNWLFYNNANYIADYRGTNHYSEDELIKINYNLTKFQNKLADKGIDFALMIPPNKATIYPEYMPKNISVVNSVSRTNQLLEYLESNSSIKIINPTNVLLDVKSNIDYNLYYKYGTHWNTVGAFVGSQELSKELLGENLSLNDVTVVQENYGVQPIGIPADNDDYTVQVRDYLDDVSLTLLESNTHDFYIKYSSTSENDKKILIIRDSFSENMYTYISKLFRETVFIHINLFSPDMIDIENPDIVVFEFVERNATDSFDLISSRFLLK